MIPCFTALYLINDVLFLPKYSKMTGSNPSRLMKISENTWDLLYGKPLK
jgi:hypothetical protein